MEYNKHSYLMRSNVINVFLLTLANIYTISILIKYRRVLPYVEKALRLK